MIEPRHFDKGREGTLQHFIEPLTPPTTQRAQAPFALAEDQEDVNAALEALLDRDRG
jgi:hypothetical protein